MSDEEKAFKVSDRRLFTPEGQPRPSPQEEEASSASTESSRTTKPTERPEAVQHGDESSGRSDAPPDLQSLILSLATQGLYLLTAPDAEGTTANPLEGVAHVIAVLEMLEEKTRGNRTPVETETLESALFELRMTYVRRRGGGGR